MVADKQRGRRHFGWLEWLLVAAVAVFLVQLAWPAWETFQNRPRPGLQVAGTFDRMGYLLYLPREYGQHADWPLLVYLHGSGQRGSDLGQIANGCGPPGQIRRGRHFPMLVVAPQCPSGERFHPAEVLALVRHIAEGFRVDRSRIYLTGYSMGGAGTWNAASEHPRTFAAIAPLCGRADPSDAGPLVGMPIWVFHGQTDQVVPLESSQAMVAAVKAAGGNAKLTIYPDRGHAICKVTYESSELYDWLLAQRRAEP